MAKKYTAMMNVIDKWNMMPSTIFSAMDERKLFNAFNSEARTDSSSPFSRSKFFLRR